jgi:hypothetical protein
LGTKQNGEDSEHDQNENKPLMEPAHKSHGLLICLIWLICCAARE